MSDILINIYQGNLVENIYCGDIAIVDKKGNPIFSVGENKKLHIGVRLLNQFKYYRLFIQEQQININ